MFNRSSPASFSTGSSSSQAGFPIPESGVISVPDDYATLTAAFEAIDAAGGVFGNRKLTIQLPDTAGTPIEEYFHWDNKDYSNIVLRGADPVRSWVNSFSGLSGSAGDYRFTIHVDAATATAAAATGYVTIESTNNNHGELEAKVLGTWSVASTTADTITVICTCQDTLASLPSDFMWTLDTHATVMKTVMQSTSSNIIFDLVNGAKSPRLAYLCLIGDGSQYLIEAQKNSEVTTVTREELGFSYPEPMHAVVCHGAATAIGIRTGSKFTGSLSISGSANGFFAQQSDFVFDFVQVSGQSSWGAFASDGSSITVLLGGVFSGNGGYGLNINRHSNCSFTYGSLIGNTGTDITASDLSFVRVFSSAYTLVGTSSPAFNVSGNTESHIMRG